MAQAARLNMRMQKELKLLLTDPPPGVSLPLLCGDADASSSSSLSSIHAQIEGPEGTVYEKGIFNITIQIPERYPFQPPNVTFGTPIYHPNIDNGGRICLDILNLPPKGAWQPSLNISTVLTSIGLLLSEPNPDDGLMCEVSREYKYDRQAFDQKARSMTQRYAKAGTRENCCSSESISTSSMTNLTEAKGPDMESKDEGNEYNVSHKKLRGISRKLSLELSDTPMRNGDNVMVNVVPNPHQFLPSCQSQVEVNGQDTKIEGFNKFYRLPGIRQKSLALSQKRGDDKENVVPNRRLVLESPKSLSMVLSKSFTVPVCSNCDEKCTHQDSDRNVGNGNIKMRSKKPLFESMDPSQKRDDDKKDGKPLISGLSLHYSQKHCPVLLQSLPMPKVFCEDDEPDFHQDHVGDLGNDCVSHKKLCTNDQKLAERSSDTYERRDDDYKVSVQRNHKLSLSQSKGLSMTPPKFHLMAQAGKKGERQPLQNHDGITSKDGLHVNSKIFLSESSGHLQNRDEEGSKLLALHQQSISKFSSGFLMQDNNCNRQQPPHEQVTIGCIKQPGGDVSPVTETVIVLDSEDSEEEATRPMKCRLSLSQRRSKLKTKV